MNFELEIPQETEKKYIENFYSNAFTEEDGNSNTTILPVGNTFLTYFKHESFAQLRNNKTFTLKGPIVAGQHYHAYQYLSSPGVSLFGVSFHPTTLYKIFQKDNSHFMDKHIPLSQIVKGHVLESITDEIYQLENLKDKISCFNNAFQQIELLENSDTKTIDKAIKLIKNSNGCIQINDLSIELGISTRGLQTKFKKIVGLSPNKYARILRFFYLLKELENSKETFASIILKYNYYDHSHFTKDYELFMGQKVSTLNSPHNQLFKSYLKEVEN